VDSDQKNFNGTAYSVAGESAWEFTPNHKISLDASHQERSPMAQELYSNGGLHGPTKSFEFGNDELTQEKSNNINLGFHGDQDALQYNLTVYHNWFDNFIYVHSSLFEQKKPDLERQAFSLLRLVVYFCIWLKAA